MRIGLFTDTYRPSINGIVFVVESLKRELEARGHEVYVFCPAKSMRPNKQVELEEDGSIIRFRSVKGMFFDDYDTSVFFPPLVRRKIKELKLDVVHVFTPSQVGLVGVQAAVKLDVPFVMQHSTDLYEFSVDYPAVLPGVLALITLIMPSTVKLNRKDMIEVARAYRPRRGVARWNQDVIKMAITLLYSKADAVIALSQKSADQLRSWQDDDYNYPITIMPNGVDPLPDPSIEEVQAFRKKFGLHAKDEVFGFVGRLGKEKNLDMLIPTLEEVVRTRPNAKLVFVGDFEYRQVLEQLAAESSCADRIVFTGALARESLGVAYRSMDVFVFPSLKDTQGWVLHEAAHAGLPIVLMDKGVTQVVVEGENGYYVENSPQAVAQKVAILLRSKKLRDTMSARGKELAAQLTEKEQVAKLECLYEKVISLRADSLK